MADTMEARSEDFGAPVGPVVKKKEVIYYSAPGGSEPVASSTNISAPQQQMSEQLSSQQEMREAAGKFTAPLRAIVPGDVVAGLTHLQILTILGAITGWWLITSHYLLAGFGLGVLYVANKFPREASLLVLAVGVPTFLWWLLRHAFTALFLVATSSLLYFFADEEAKLRLNAASMRFWHSMRRVLEASSHNVNLLASQAKESIVQTVESRSAQTSS